MSHSREAEIRDARLNIVAAARRMLGQNMSFIGGAREICALRDAAALDYFDRDVLPFVAISSETDDLPLGEERKLWSSEALAKLQPQLDRAEQWARDAGTKHCRQLIGRLGQPDRPLSE